MFFPLTKLLKQKKHLPNTCIIAINHPSIFTATVAEDRGYLGFRLAILLQRWNKKSQRFELRNCEGRFQKWTAR